jgi:hypothetical protein
MTMNLHDGTNHNGLFDLQGKAFVALNDLNTNAASTIPAAVQAVIEQYKKKTDSTLTMNEALDGLAAAVASWQSDTTALSSPLTSYCSQLLREFVLADAAQPVDTLSNALNYLIAQMTAGADYVTPNAVATSLAVGGSNIGDAVILYDKHRGDGRVQENSLAEAIAIAVTNDSSASSPTVTFTGLPSVGLLDPTWPQGSGIGLSIAAFDPTSSQNLVTNGGFENSTNPPVPDNWDVIVGTPGTTFLLTPTAVQTVTITGGPTGGTFVLEFTYPSGLVRPTGPLSYAATAQQMQAALQALPGLSAITVTLGTVGGNPVYTVTFNGVAGDLTALSALNYLTGGSSPGFTIATTTHGDNGAYRAQAFEFISNGSELTTLQTPINPSYETVYFCHFRCRRTGAATAGSVKVDVTSGVGGATTQDDQGNNNSLVVNATAIPTTSFLSQWFSFRLKKSVIAPLYLRLAINAAIDNAVKIYIDDLVVIPGIELYDGGPFVQVISGTTAAVDGDNWTLTVTNDRGGQVQEWYNRAFNMGGQELLLPSAGSTLIPNSVIS